MLELERRGFDIAYVRTAEDYEVDFLATAPGEVSLLVQVCAESRDPATLERETRALERARPEFPDADALLLTLDAQPPRIDIAKGVRWMPASAWLLGVEA